MGKGNMVMGEKNFPLAGTAVARGNRNREGREGIVEGGEAMRKGPRKNSAGEGSFQGSPGQVPFRARIEGIATKLIRGRVGGRGQKV